MQRETACRLVHYHHIMRSMDQGRCECCLSGCCVRVPVSLPSRGSAGPPGLGSGPCPQPWGRRGGQEGSPEGPWGRDRARGAWGRDRAAFSFGAGWFEAIRHGGTDPSGAASFKVQPGGLSCSKASPQESLTNPALNPCSACASGARGSAEAAAALPGARCGGDRGCSGCSGCPVRSGPCCGRGSGLGAAYGAAGGDKS